MSSTLAIRVLSLLWPAAGRKALETENIRPFNKPPPPYFQNGDPLHAYKLGDCLPSDAANPRGLRWRNPILRPNS